MKKQPTTARPILFSAEMVRAILEGRKTQTRRIIKSKIALEWLDEIGFKPEFVALFENDLCPYGKFGDRLWVRETWAKQLDGKYIYRANHQDWELADYTATGAWRPSIFMPRAASRLLLEITDISAERLQDITEADAIAEGAELLYKTDDGFYHPEPETVLAVGHFGEYKIGYECLWEKINGPHSWEQNPWVWVITFRIVSPLEGG